MDPKTADMLTHYDITLIRGRDMPPLSKESTYLTCNGLSDGVFSFLLSTEQLASV